MAENRPSKAAWKTQEGMSPADQANAGKSMNAANHYALGADSLAKAGVAKGTVSKYHWKSEKIYPGTERDYWLYVPANTMAHSPPI